MSQIYRAEVIRVSYYYVPDAQFRAGLTTVLRAGWLDAIPGGGIQRTKCPGDDILYCLSGRGRIETETHNFDLGPGQLARIAGDKSYGHFADECEPWSLMWFRLDGPDLTTLRRRLFGNRWSRMTIVQSSELIDWFHNLFLILKRQRIDTDLSLNAAIASFIQLLGRQRNFRADDRVPQPIDKLRQLIAANPERNWLA